MILLTPVLHVYDGNADHVRSCLETSFALDGRISATLLVFRERPYREATLVDLLNRCFENWKIIDIDSVGTNLKWPLPQNLAWQRAARWIDAHADELKTRGWLWWEADAFPLVKNWLTILDKAYRGGRKLFAGVTCRFGDVTYMNGVGIYPTSIVPALADCSALYCRDTPFDIAAAPCVMRSFIDISHLLIHVRKQRGGVSVRLTQPRLDSLRLRHPEAVFLHGFSGGSRSTDQSVQKIDSQDGSVPSVPSVTTQTEWPCGLFTFPPTHTLTAFFNPSLIRFQGKRWLFTRRQQFDGEPGSFEHNHSDLAIFELRDNNTLKLPMLVPQTPNRYPFEQWEDPRAVVGTDGSVYVSHATWVHYRNWNIRQAFCRLSPDWRSLEIIQEPHYGGNTSQPTVGSRHEKNWTFFEHDSRWWFIYTINPHVVVPLPGRRMPNPCINSPKVLLWPHGEPRGGTPPVRTDDQYICFFHSATEWVGTKRRYYMGAYAFSSKQPFGITHMTEEPILIGSEEDFRTMSGPPCVFPNGALLEDGHWTVVFGVNDEGSGWITIPHRDLMKRMKPI